jgi:hypothetical protein
MKRNQVLTGELSRPPPQTQPAPQQPNPLPEEKKSIAPPDSLGSEKGEKTTPQAPQASQEDARPVTNEALPVHDHFTAPDGTQYEAYRMITSMNGARAIEFIQQNKDGSYTCNAWCSNLKVIMLTCENSYYTNNINNVVQIIPGSLFDEMQKKYCAPHPPRLQQPGDVKNHTIFTDPDGQRYMAAPAEITSDGARVVLLTPENKGGGFACDEDCSKMITVSLMCNNYFYITDKAGKRFALTPIFRDSLLADVQKKYCEIAGSSANAETSVTPNGGPSADKSADTAGCMTLSNPLCDGHIISCTDGSQTWYCKTQGGQEWVLQKIPPTEGQQPSDKQ